MLTDKIIFFTIISDDFYEGCRTDDFIKSFKKFHPDIELKVFRQKEIEEVFATDSRLNFYNCKAYFMLKLIDKYDLVVNIDADHLIFERLTDILEGDYDLACPSNYNLYQNASIGCVDEKMYLQAGIVACTSKLFLRFWNDYSLYKAMKYPHKENDTLNLVLDYSEARPWSIKHLDGELSTSNAYYGCASLGQEHLIVVNKNRLELNGKPVKAYHFAKGDRNKPHPRTLFSEPVINWVNENLNTNY